MGPLETDKSGLPPPYPYVTATPFKQTNEPSTWEKWLIYGAAAIFGIIATLHHYPKVIDYYKFLMTVRKVLNYFI